MNTLETIIFSIIISYLIVDFVFSKEDIEFVIKKLNNMIFHKHNFVELERFYAEPFKGDMENMPNNNSSKKILFGQTTLLYRCVNKEYSNAGGAGAIKIGQVILLGCGKTYQETILGKSLK